MESIPTFGIDSQFLTPQIEESILFGIEESILFRIDSQPYCLHVSLRHKEASRLRNANHLYRNYLKLVILRSQLVSR